MSIPKDVPLNRHAEFMKNYTLLTKATGNLFLFSADHKMEHLDTDFQGPDLPPEIHKPHHLFEIANRSPIGGMASQLGLIARYGSQYPDITYVPKLNSKTNLVPLEKHEPLSRLLWTVDDVIAFKKSSGLTIAGIGVTVYLGSTYEDLMLEQAAQAVFQAHQEGLVAILWMYPRGSAVTDETDPHLLAGAVGVAACLGADFVKIHPPKATKDTSRAELLRTVVEAAGTTKVISAGGSFKNAAELLKNIKEEMAIGGISGAAIGRSLFQHSLKDAVEVSRALSRCIYGDD